MVVFSEKERPWFSHIETEWAPEYRPLCEAPPECQQHAVYHFSPQVLPLCEAHYHEMKERLLMDLHCRYCEEQSELQACAVCGFACCPEHGWFLKDEWTPPQGHVECIDCMGK